MHLHKSDSTGLLGMGMVVTDWGMVADVGCGGADVRGFGCGDGHACMVSLVVGYRLLREIYVCTGVLS